MPLDAISNPLVMDRLTTRIASEYGLKIPPQRHGALNKALLNLGRAAGLADAEEYALRLLDRQGSPQNLLPLVSRVAVGETYFFRDRELLLTLEHRILAPLIKKRRSGSRRLRIMSAGCSTGEEAYTLAIMVRRLLPDLSGWKVSILGADINRASLDKARAGIYTRWSFRKGLEDPPAAFFIPEPGRRWRIAPEIRSMTTFIQLNLAEGAYPSHHNGTVDLDLVLCRNVFMYFTPEMSRTSIARLRDCLVPGGHLVLGASEACLARMPGLEPSEHVGILMKTAPRFDPAQGVTDRSDAFSGLDQPSSERLSESCAPARPDSAPTETPPAPDEQRSPAPDMAEAVRHYEAGRYPQAVAMAERLAHAPGKAGGADWSQAVRILVLSLANMREHARADAEALRAIALDKLNPQLRYLRANILLEADNGLLPQAKQELLHALYLDDRFALAHFLLGELARSEGKLDAARRHFANARNIAGELPQDTLLGGSEDMSAGHLAALLDTIGSPGGRQ